MGGGSGAGDSRGREGELGETEMVKIVVDSVHGHSV